MFNINIEIFSVILMLNNNESIHNQNFSSYCYYILKRMVAQEEHGDGIPNFLVSTPSRLAQIFKKKKEQDDIESVADQKVIIQLV